MLFDFIRITNEVLSKEIPNLLITNVNYRSSERTNIINVHFYDLDFQIKGFQFMYYVAPNPLKKIDYDLILEFTNYLDDYVRPIFKK